MKQALLAMFFTGLITASILAADWPLFRGPDRDGKTSDTSAPLTWSADKNIKWKITLPSKGNSSPIVSAGKVFLSIAEDAKGTKRSLYCYDRNDGKTLWVKTVSYDKAEPTHAANPYCGSTPAADGQRIVVWHGSAGVFCYDYNGKQLWSHDLGTFHHIWGYAASPIFVGDSIILNCGPGNRSFVTALDKTTGRTLWETPEPGGADDRSPQSKNWLGSWATPQVVNIANKSQILVAQPGHVNAYDPTDGHILWTCAGTGDLAYMDVMLGNGVSSGTAVAMAGYGGKAMGFKLGGSGDVTATHRLWQSTDKPPQRISNGIVVGPHLFTANEPHFACYEMATGKELWRFRPPSQVFWAAITATPERLYVTSQNGPSYVFAPDAKEFKLLATNDLGEGTNASIAISNGQIFLRTFTHLYCIAGQ